MEFIFWLIVLGISLPIAINFWINLFKDDTSEDFRDEYS